MLVARFQLTRDHLLRVLRAAARRRSPASRRRPGLNELAAAAPTVRLLGTRPGQHFTGPVSRTDQATRFCADIAAAAIDLLTGPDAATVALCDAPGCGQLYLRGRPNQQWCNPHCGTRARSQRHAERNAALQSRPKRVTEPRRRTGPIWHPCHQISARQATRAKSAVSESLQSWAMFTMTW